jgi:aminopeptidase N
MKTTEPRAIYLKDYQPPDYRIPEIALDFILDPGATLVSATMRVIRATTRVEADVVPLTLDGKTLKLLSLKIDGETLETSAYVHDENQLTILAPPDAFTLEITTEIAPAKNTALEGLYMAKGMYCTQCEPEGFRAITYYLDRPDNLAKFETRIEATQDAHPVLLSNGNLIESGILSDGRHFARWQDPFPKPSYLFALVAGDLGSINGTHVTASGKNIDLRIYVEHGNEARAEYALDSLKRSMQWDEEVYSREYDLDIFMVVAVSAFNFGAMENKGLNIFNDKLLLASPETATDDDYARIECVVGHEYFHNWTGNRITCRDWFQLSLKEGLTVFRESRFAGDMRSHSVRRISDVRDLRLRQFGEDSGPLAHPVQPQSYIAIDNFYTATVYEKGAEVISMLESIVGNENFRKGMDLYFKRHDGHAATVEDFLRCFEDVSARDLKQFRLWYCQAGTPEISAIGEYNASTSTYCLRLSQNLNASPGQSKKVPMHIPITLGLIGQKTMKPLPLTLQGENTRGSDDRTLELTTKMQEFVFKGIEEDPVLSLGRNFSAPARFHDGNGRVERAFLMRHDTNSFNRWEAGQKLFFEIALEMIQDIQAGIAAKVDALYLESFGGVIARAIEDTRTEGGSSDDPGFNAQILMPPSENELALAMDTIDPEAIHTARYELIRTVASAHGPEIERLYLANSSAGAFSPGANAAGKRALRNAAFRYLTAQDDAKAGELAFEHYSNATNMTDMMAGLGALTRTGGALERSALENFYHRFQNDALVLDKWMGVQAMSPRPDTVERVRDLMDHSIFSIKNPNRVRALIGSFAAGNPLRFHDKSGSGYRLVAENIRKLDAINPQTAARMATSFENWRKYDAKRQGLMRGELEDIIVSPKGASKVISANLYEIVNKILGANEA